MLWAGLDAGIASWWDQGSKEDDRIPMLLDTANGTSFRWSLYYEPEGYGDPSVAELSDDISYIGNQYGGAKSYLRVDGKPVIFVYADGADGCSMANRWTRANEGRAYIVLKVFSGYRNCVDQPDAWHQYAPAVARDQQDNQSFSVSPGFWLKGGSERLARNAQRFDADVADMATSGARFQLVTTYNEWGEGTAVESADEWTDTSGHGIYMSILRSHLVKNASPDSEPPVSGGSSTGSAPVIAAAGDIACKSTDGNFKAGLGSATACRQKYVADLFAGQDLAAVLPLGDIQYEDGTYSDYLASYDLSWGTYRSITRPAIGNHEYLTSGADGYFRYFGQSAGDPAKGYYSYDVGAWHVVALNSNCSKVGGCSAGSPQQQWLKADLAAHPSECTLAYWHHPRFSSGEHGDHTSMTTMWQTLYDDGAELVLSGHDHDYERFAPMNASGQLDVTRGLRQFVVGTGGKNHYGITALRANSEVANTTTYGALFLTLRDHGYDWEFRPESSGAFSDSGRSSCH
jgi:hypothetical protein